ncbi:2-hydroxy-3-oxopropionate reductase [Palleronia aestuarii]|uniref:2-hydroxy-3-oxopropionate reductase n=1 Tax=Palleronia aestuarii TaxID=568105 RepID=A0A2W7NEE3_9RHOB|nr:NAD(P)-dependent oxidoreductase [Palleronia aestuarii]PZX18795.1 2-hydroxy-3-oxopropionate reductase [Palleronia aestuarii]
MAEKIGFIGLGLMGSAMVGRLQDKGHALTVVANRSRKGVDAAVERGATEVDSARKVAEASDIVMLCMDTSDNVEARMFGDDGVIAGAKEGLVVVDFGTSLPTSTKKIGEALTEKGATYLDAPLGRTPAHAKDGALNIMCSGDEAAYDRVKPVLEELGENVFHLGPLGTGHTIKLINNFFAMTTAMAMSEAFAMADATGVPRQKLYDVMSAGPLKSGMMDFIKNFATDGQIDLAFSMANGSKDVGYYRQMAENFGANSRMSACADATLNEAKENGWGDRMIPEMVDYLSERLKK